MDVDNKVDQQLDAHIQVLMRTLRPHANEVDAAVMGRPTAKETWNLSGTVTVSQASAAETGSFGTDQQHTNCSPLTAAHLPHHDTEALEVLSSSPLGDKLNLNGHAAPHDLLRTSLEGHQDVHNSPHTHYTMSHVGDLGTGPYEPSYPCGANEQLRALQEIDRLQQASMKRNFLEVSPPVIFDSAPSWQWLILLHLAGRGYVRCVLMQDTCWCSDCCLLCRLMAVDGSILAGLP